MKDTDAMIRIAYPDGKTPRMGRKTEAIDSDEPTMNLSGVTGHDSGERTRGLDGIL